jgi:lysozyme family protein
MAEFNPALEKVLNHEGGYANDPNDPGGETYKGVARKIHSKWDGWTIIDIQKKQPGFPAILENDANLQQKIREFYETQFWARIKGDEITNQEVALSIFDFAVNAGTATSASLAQKVVDAVTDGVIGTKTLEKLNAFNPDHFLAAFAVAKIARYIQIVEKNSKTDKYFYGWVRRALNDI